MQNVYYLYTFVNMEIQERLKMIMKMHNLNASQFADTIEVQRSSISHVLSGRNKPSLDFIEKILNHFPRVNADCLITGIAKSTKIEEEQANVQTLFTDQPKIKTEEVVKTPEIKVKEDKVLKKVMLLYTDGTFETYQASEQ